MNIDLCSSCGCVLFESTDWDGDSTECQACIEDGECFAWLDRMQEQVEQSAKSNSWEVDNIHFARDSRSRYITLTKENQNDIKVRISDHATMYAKETISIDYTERDHTIQTLINLLSQ